MKSNFSSEEGYLWLVSFRSFNVCLLQVYVGKEKETVSDMLPYLRLGYVSDPSEMQSVISSQGPVCPVSLSLSSLIDIDFWLSEIY